MIVLIDNYDSFSYNVYQLIGSVEPDIKVIRNDEYTVKEIEAMNPEALILSPGPGKPSDAGICIEAIQYFAGKLPILGICLGHQAICEAFGGEVSYAKELMHGKKKTIYTVFPDKNSLVLEMVDYCFASIKESEQRVIQNPSLDTVGKIRAILGVLPEGYRELDLRQLYQLKEKYPEVYEKVKSRLETGWESTISLLEQGIAEGKIRNIRIPILKTMMEATLEQFFQRDVLIVNEITYTDALEELVNIIVDGISIERIS